LSIIVDNLPVIRYDEVAKVGLVRKDIEKGVFERHETPVQIMMNDHQMNSDERIEISHNENEPTKTSANLEALYYLIQKISRDMEFVDDPNFTGKIRHDTMIRARIEKYYSTSRKKYAKEIKIHIDGLIKYDNYPVYLFDDYVRLEKTIASGASSEIVDQFLLKLLTIVRQIIPPNFNQINTYVVDSNSVDPNKVE